ncbi:hypothetical protein [Bombilactobacillus bombi]|nr:hypothetical protein [Bombilactobacillus bombi]
MDINKKIQINNLEQLSAELKRASHYAEKLQGSIKKINSIKLTAKIPTDF